MFSKKKLRMLALAACGLFVMGGTALAKEEKLTLTQEWDKVFPKSAKVDHQKVTFVNRYGITLAADMYVPKNAEGKLAALAVAGPFGAVKEQVSGQYAQAMAERGFLTIAFDPSFTGESGGSVRDIASPDINTEDFQAAVDYLSNHKKVDPAKIGMLGICGWGGMAINAAALDTRVKATAAITMYDMSDLFADGYKNGFFPSEDSEEHRYNKKVAINAARTAEYNTGKPSFVGGCLELPVPDNMPQFIKEYSAYYKDKNRGYHPRSVGSNKGWQTIGYISFMNQPMLEYSDEIRSAVLLVHGEKAHSLYFSKEAYKDMLDGNKYKDNKELYIVPGAVHTDLYDNPKYLPYDKLEGFFNKYLQ